MLTRCTVHPDSSHSITYSVTQKSTGEVARGNKVGPRLGVGHTVTFNAPLIKFVFAERGRMTDWPLINSKTIVMEWAPPYTSSVRMEPTILHSRKGVTER